MTALTPEQRALGRDNANTSLGLTRRDFLKGAAAAPVLGAFYFGYKSMGEQTPVRAAIIGTGNEGCGAMIQDHNRDYLNYIGCCDIRPSNQKRAVAEFTKHPQYSERDVKQLRKYADIKEILADNDVEMLVIALPLHLHAPIAIEAMKAGKHVFTEKLMAHNVGQCKEMIRIAHDTNRLLAVGHQRHYSILYDNANYLVQNNVLGDIRHIRALWHRNNACAVIEKDKSGNLIYDKDGRPVYKRDDKGHIQYFDSWKPDIPAIDRDIDYARYGYKSLDELIRWRLYSRTGAGLMAELGGHQLDACSIFLNRQYPIAVAGVGGKFFFDDDRECDDHVFCTYEFPGAKGNADDRVIVTYSSINTNRFENYGEMVYGNRGTMVVEEEKEILLFKEPNPNNPKGGGGRNTSITMETKGKQPVMETSPSAVGPNEASSLGGTATSAPISRGYREELEHFAYCIRHGGGGSEHKDYHGDVENQPRCRGEVAMADAIMALTSNLAMSTSRRIEFQSSWFDYKTEDVPDGSAEEIASRA